MKFSIGIPAYKDMFLEECIKSVLSQTYEDFELIILNDCSPHKIDMIIERFDDERIKYYKNEYNVGAENVVINWNKCLELATGDYFACIGDDDVLAPNYLQSFLDLINRFSIVNVFHCRTIVIDEDSIPYTITPLCPEYENIYNYMLGCIKGERHQFLGDFVYKRDFLVEKGGFYFLPLGWISDYLTSFIITIDTGIAYTSDVVFKYRSSVQNITSTGSLDLKRIASLGFYEWINNFCSDRIIRNNMEEYEYKMLEQCKDKVKKEDELGFIRQFLGGKRKNILRKLYVIIKNRKKFELELKNIFKVIFMFFFD